MIGELADFLNNNGYSNLVEEFKEQGVLTMVALKNMDEEDLVKYIKCSNLVASSLLKMAKNYPKGTNPSNSDVGQIVSVPSNNSEMKMVLMENNFKMEQMKSKYEMELKIKELEYKSIMNDKLNETKYKDLEEKLKHMDTTNDLKRQITEEKFKGETAVMAAKFAGDKAVLTAKLEAQPAQFIHVGPHYPYPGNPYYPPDTVLLTIAFFNNINNWLGRNIQWVLRYRGTRNSFGSANFHSCCNNVGPTITIVRSTNGFLFGGYNPNAWGITGNYQGGGGSFIFTLSNPYGSVPTVFHFKSGNGPYDHPSYGPTWGGGHDLYISNGCNGNNSSYSNFPNSYSDILGYGNNTFTGAKNFQVAEIEVFSV